MRTGLCLFLLTGLLLGLASGAARAAALEHCVKAEEAYQAGDHALEIALYTRCIDEDGPEGAKLAVAHNNRGVAHLAVGDPDSAIEDYDQALALLEGYAEAHANRGMAQVAKGAFVEALRDYGTAIELDPAYAPARVNRCWLFGHLGFGDAALNDCNEALRLSPEDPAILDRRAYAFWLLEDQPRARKDLQLARSLDPRRPRWQARFAAFEERFSIKRPTSAAIQSVDRRAQRTEPVMTRRAAAQPYPW